MGISKTSEKRNGKTCKSSFMVVERKRRPVEASDFGTGLNRPCMNFRRGDSIANLTRAGSGGPWNIFCTNVP